METEAGVEEIYIALQGGAKMQRVEEIQAVAGLGLQGDRYSERTDFNCLCKLMFFELFPLH